MQPIRVLIVDHSTMMQRVLSDLLASAPGIVVVGTAGNGSQALARISEFKPDLVTLDIEMPGMDGLHTLVEIRNLYPKLPVIALSSVSERGASATLDALARGAGDYVTKPLHGETLEHSHERVRDELLRKIKFSVRSACTTANASDIASDTVWDNVYLCLCRLRPAAGADRHGRHRRIDRWTERADFTDSATSRGFPGADRGRAARAGLAVPAGHLGRR